MKRSREEHIIHGFPNEIVLHCVIGIDVKVMGKLATTSNEMRRWLDEQPNLYFTLFKHNFKNEYCLLYDMLAHKEDMNTHLEHQLSDEITLALAFSCYANNKYIKDHPINLNFILNGPFARIIQYYNPSACTYRDDPTEDLYREYCPPWDPLIIERCRSNPAFASKMARLFNTILHPCGYPDASYYMQFQSRMRSLVCRMLRILDQCTMYEPDVSDDAWEIRNRLIHYISAMENTELSEKLQMSEKSEDEKWEKGEEDEDGNFTSSCSLDVITSSFISKLDALPIEQLPPKRDAACLYQWWQENAVPYLQTIQPGDFDWVIKEDPGWYDDKKDILYYDTIDDVLYKKHILPLFLEYRASRYYKAEQNQLLKSIKKDYAKDKNIARLEQHCFRLFLYRLLNNPLTPQNYTSPVRI